MKLAVKESADLKRLVPSLEDRGRDRVVRVDDLKSN